MAKKFSNYFTRGFTLVEILIGVTAAAVVGGLLIGLLSQNSRIFTAQHAKVTQGLEINRSFSEIEETIKSASAVVSQYPLVGQSIFTTNQTTLVVALPALNIQGVVIPNTYDYTVIYKDPQNTKLLRKKTYPNALSSRKSEDEVLSTKLSKLEFNYIDSVDQPITPTQSVKIGFVINVADNVFTSTQTSSVSGQINLRNN